MPYYPLADITRTRTDITINTAGKFTISSQDFVKGTLGWYVADETDIGRTYGRSELIQFMNNIRENDNGDYWNFIKGFKNNPVLLTDLNPIPQSPEELAQWEAAKAAQIAERAAIAAAKAAAEAEALRIEALEEAALIAQVEAGELPWWMAPLNKTVVGKNAMNIGGFRVLWQTMKLGVGNSSTYYYVTGKRSVPTQFNYLSSAKQINLSAEFIKNHVYLEAGTLIDPVTHIPDLEKTAQWWAEDPNANLIRKKFPVGVAGGYYLGELENINPVDFPIELVTDLEGKMAEINGLFAAAGAPECRIVDMVPCQVKTSWQDALFFADGGFNKYGRVQERKIWCWRIGLKINDQTWNNSDISIWMTYNPQISQTEPWRLVKSSRCQRQSAWSKYDSHATHQVEPEHSHGVVIWCMQFLSQLTGMHPQIMKPIYVGGTSRGKNRMSTAKNTMGAALDKIKQELGKIKVAAA